MSGTTPDPAAVREALGEVTDPDLGGDVVASGLVGDVTVADGVVTVEATFAGLDPTATDDLVERMRQRVLELPGVSRARVEHDAPEGGPEQSGVDGVDRVLAVASAKGGVGKTTVATQLARALSARGESVGLFDADVYGPNVPDLLGVSGPVETAESGGAAPIEADDLQVMSVGCIANDEPLAWRGAMAQEAVLELLEDTAWNGLDTLVVDLPPGTGDIVLTALQSLAVDGVLLVTTPFPTAVSDTGRSAALFREQGVPVVGAVANMAGFTCPTCGDEHAPFGSDPDLDVDVLAELPVDEDLRNPDGAVPDPLLDLADAVAAGLDDAATFSVPDGALDLRSVPERAAVEQATAEFRALSPGDPLFVLADADPRPLASAVAARTDCETTPETAVQRRGPEEWALRIEKPGGGCGCGGHGHSHADD